MHVWLDLIFRELLFVAVVGALGSAPATFLPQRFDRIARLAMAPVLGLCVGVCVTVTLVYYFPARETSWFVVLLALVSLGLAAWRIGGWPLRSSDRRRLAEAPEGLTSERSRGGARRITHHGLIQIAVVVIVILVSFDYPLALRHTVGPEGGWAIADTAGYVSETNGEAHQSIRRTRLNPVPYADLSLYGWAAYAAGYQQLDISALEANLNELTGVGSTDTDSPFLIAVVLVGALAVFALVRAVSGTASWAAVVAGCLFGGPLFVELFMDGSQAAIAGSALLSPTVVLGCEALWGRRLPTLVLFALLLAGLQTVYPLFLPPIVIAAAAAIAFLVVRRLLRSLPTWPEVWLAIGQLALVVGLAAVFTPVAFSRNLRYWSSLLHGSLSFLGLPVYALPFNILPGWVLQTREFYGLVDLSNATAGQLFMGAALPLAMIAVVVFVARRQREVLMMLVVAAAAALLAAYTWFGRDCSYCVQRNLIPIGALAPAALGLGIAGIAALRWRGGVIAAALIGLVVVIAVGHEGIVERQRVANGSYLLDPQERQAVAALPAHPGRVDMEGYSQAPQPPMELPMVYNLLDERSHGEVSIATNRDDNSGLAYLGGVQPLGPAFDPAYAYVLTRLGGISTARRVVARYGAIALEQRTDPLDVSVTGGVSVASARADPTGTAWVNPTRPLHFLVAGSSPTGRAWISLVLAATVPVRASAPAGFSMTREGDTIHICVEALGSGPIRQAGFQLAFVPQPVPPPAERFATPLPPRGVRLVSMRASSTPCRR